MPAEISFRRLTESDLPMLHEWLNRPHIASHWGGPTPWEKVQTDFQEHIQSDTVFGYIASMDCVPLGYAQTYNAHAVGDGWWPDAAPGTWGIDQSLANEDDLDRGYGTELVKRFSDFVFRHHGADLIITDPTPDNGRAIRCYEKAGFAYVGLADTPDGRAWLMEKKRPARS